MRILAIDPSSNVHKTSTTGIALLDNATVIDVWVVPYGIDNLTDWFQTVGKGLTYDQVVIERYDVKHGDEGRDNSTKLVMEHAMSLYPEADCFRNVGYATDVPDALLKKLGMWLFTDKTHHHDIRSACRLALFWAMRNDIQEVVNAMGDKLYENQ